MSRPERLAKPSMYCPSEERKRSCAQNWWMHQIAEGTQFLHRFLQRRLNSHPKAAAVHAAGRPADLKFIKVRSAATRCCTVESCNSCAIFRRSSSWALATRSETFSAWRSNFLRAVMSATIPRKPRWVAGDSELAVYLQPAA